MEATCLEESVLLEFIDGDLAAGEAERVNAHLATCAECRALVAELVRGLHPSSDAGPLRRGTSLGRYLVLDCVGAGGMGVVYNAYDPELDRRVALKLVRSDRGPDEGPSTEHTASQERLLQEARSMARLSHPNVAAVYDVGTYEDRVFLAMELIIGETLRVWLAAGRPRLAVLDAFLQAGRGLAAAHRAGIVHRDFKPDNVLVARDGRVCVLDFGLAFHGQSDAPEPHAHLRSPASRGDERLTQTGAVLGTPRYMAPEQRDGARADARSDQYSFCLALREALPPDPLPARLRRALERGLQADPDARFPSMDPLLEVLVESRGVNARVRALQVGAAALVVALGSGGFWYQRAQAQRCSGAEQQLATAWDGDRAALISRAFDRDLEGARKTAAALDAFAAKWVAMHRDACEATRVRGEQSEELLDRRMVCLSGQLSQLRAVAGLLSEGNVAVKRSREALASLPEVSDCADTRTLLDRAAAPRDPAARQRLADATEQLARAKVVRATLSPDALPLSQKMLELAQSVGDPSLLADAWLNLATVQRNIASARDAETSLWHSVENARAGRDARLEAEAWLLLVKVAAKNLRDRQRAERYLGLGAAVVHSLAAPGPLETRLLIADADLSTTFGENARAIPSYRTAVARYEKEKGPEAVEVAQVLLKLGEALHAEQQYVEAEQVLRRCVTLCELDAVLKAKVDIALTSWGEVLGKLGRFDEGRAALVRAVEVAERHREDPDRARTVLGVIGALERGAGDYGAAERYFLRELARARELTDSNSFPGEALAHLGEVYLLQKDYARAEEHLGQALAVWAKTLDATELNPVGARVRLGRVRLARGDKPGALALFDAAEKVLAESKATPAVLGPYRFLLAQALGELGGAEARALALATAASAVADPLSKPEIERWISAHAPERAPAQGQAP